MSEDPPPYGEPPPPRRFPVHPVDLLVLVLGLGLAALAYAYLFRTSPIPRPVDPLLGVELEVRFLASEPWKEEFPPVGGSVLLNDYLEADVLDRRTVDDGGMTTVHARLRIRDRETQKPEAMTLFRTGVRRGTVLVISDPTSEVAAEVIAVGDPPGSK